MLMQNDNGDEILVHPSKVEWMEANGWFVVDEQTEEELKTEEVKENGSDYGA